MAISTKILGFIICCAGAGLWYIDYWMITTVGAPMLWIAAVAGITSMAAVGAPAWNLLIGVIIPLFVFGFGMVYSGLNIIIGT